MVRRSLVPNWLRKLMHGSVRSATERTVQSVPRGSRLLLESLELRLTPASATYSAGLFTLTGLSGSANNVVVSTPSNNHVKIVLGNGDSFTAAPANAAFVLSQTTNPNDTLTINSVSAPLSTLAINLGSAADTLVVGLGGASVTSTGVGNVSINPGTGNDQTTLNTVNINGNLNVLGGTITVAAANSLSTHGGNVSLTATGTNATLTINSNITSGNGSVTLQATGNLVVGTGVTVDSGTGALSVSADVQANGTGDDGVGTLTVNSGAQLYGASINLQGADEDIASTAAVGKASAPPTVSTIASGINAPFGVAVDAGGNVYVANYTPGTVSKYNSIGTLINASYISGLTHPESLAFDTSGNLYVANGSIGTVSKYDSSGTLINATYLSGLSNPGALAFDASGSLYVSLGGSYQVNKYSSSGTAISVPYISGLSDPIALAFDGSGNLYVANFVNGTVSEFSSTGSSINATFVSGLSNPAGLAFDSSGNLYVTSNTTNSVSEYSSTGTLITSSYVPGLHGPAGLAFDANGNLYIVNNAYNTVTRVAPPRGLTTQVTIESSLDSRPMSLGGSNNTAVAGINLTSAELANIVTTAGGTITIGDSTQTGTITFSGAIVATTAGASTVVLQSTADVGGIVLDDSNGTALDGNGGTISLTAGSGGITALNSDDSTAEIATSGASVTLNTTGVIGMDGNRIQFADNSNTSQQIVSIGTSNLPSSTFLDGLGNLTLGNVTSIGLDVTARANLVVVDNALVDSSTAVLSLAADVTPDGTGYDGVGTLTISSGALLFGASINLRGADMEIASSASVGTVTLTTQVTIRSSLSSLSMSLGGSNNTAVVGINLTSAELANIVTTAGGTITIGDSTQTGTITFSGAIVATTAGASTVVVQSTAASGAIVLDDSNGTALDGNGGTISLTAGSGGITALNSDDSTAEIATSGASVTLSTTGVIGMDGNRIQFADNSDTTQQIVSIGTSNLPSSTFLDGLGNLTLGNVTSIGLDVTARANLVVVDNAIVDSSTAVLSLAADVNADGTGDDGVGTLSISAGAHLYGASLILRGADIDIASSASVGSAIGSPPIVTTFASGLRSPVGPAFDASGNLYIADQVDGTVSEFDALGDLLNAFFVTGLSTPSDLAFDASGNLYVANSGDGTVSEFDASGNLLNGSFVSGLTNPTALAFDASGNLYVTDAGNNTVSEYSSSDTLINANFASGLNSPTGLAFDASGNLYVANSGDGTVSEFDASGNLLNASFVSGLTNPTALAFDTSGNLYVADAGNNTVSEYSSSDTLINANFASGLNSPTGLAFDASGNLYIANGVNGTITKVLPSVVTTQVTIQSSLENRPMSIGGTNNAAVAGINLTSAELARIVTTANGTITIGDGNQTGNIIFSGATVATTPGAATVVIQYSLLTGGIVLDDSNGTALNGNGGTISLTAGTGGITALNANDSTAEIATTGASVELDTTGVVGTASHRIQFANNSNTAQQIVGIGTSNQPSSVYLDGLGNLTLGTITSNGVDATAPGNLVVASNDSVNSGSNTLSLAADVQANGVGDNGVGTLTVSAGANIEGATIILRGADEDIANTASVSSVVPSSVTSFGSANLNGPAGVAIDANGNVYVTNQGSNTVSEYSSSGTLLNANFITGLSNPSGLRFDANGNLYLANRGTHTVREYSSSGTLLHGSVVSGLTNPFDLAFDSHGNLYVADFATNRVSEYTSSGTLINPSFATGLNGPSGLAFAANGDLFVTNQIGGTVSEYSPSGSLINASFASGLSNPLGLAIDAQGNVFVANYLGGTVSEFNSSGKLLDPGYITGLLRPTGLAIDAGGNLYAGDYFGSTVSKATPPGLTNPVTIRSSVESRPMYFGGSNNAVVAGINLTSAELARIITVAGSTITIGDSSQTGNITFANATIATTPGAATVVVQSPSGPGTIILDATNGIGLNGNGGLVSLTPGTGQLSAALSSTYALIASNGFNATGLTFALTLTAVPTSNQQNTLVQDTGSAINGSFTGLTDGGQVAVSFESASYNFAVSYESGEGHDLVLTQIPVTSGGLSGVVFVDTQLNGIRTPTSIGLAGVTVFVDLNHNGTLDANEPSTTTDSGGGYSFVSLPSGVYFVVVDVNNPSESPTLPSGGIATVTVIGGQGSSQDFGVFIFGASGPVNTTPSNLFGSGNSDANHAFVRGLYHALLQRDASGNILISTGQMVNEADYWANLMTAGMTRKQVADLIVNSPEHRQLEVAYFYQTLLHRSTDSQAVVWIDQLIAGVSEARVTQGIMDSPEYQAAHADNTIFIQDLYFEILGRSASFSEVNSNTSLLNGGMSRSNLEAQVINSMESAQRQVEGFYSAFFHRTADAGGAATWATELLTGMSASQVEATMLADPNVLEFYNRGLATVV